MSNPFSPAGMAVIYPRQRAWSYSAVSNHAKCPMKVRFAKIDRYPDPPSPQMGRGLDVHKACAAMIDHGVDQGLLTDDWAARVRELHQRKAMSEKQLAFTVDWIVTDWFAPNVWGRVVVDAVDKIADGIYTIVEFKTGKAYPEHSEQLRLYALAGFIMFPDATEVRSTLWYLDGPPVIHPGYVAQRSAVDRLKQEFKDFAQPLLNDDMYPARPGRGCNWCNFRKSNNGPCAHG